jgi:hypothetical protein
MKPGLAARALAGSGLVLAGTLLAVLLGEGALRLAGISFPVFEVQDATRGVALKPGKEGWYRKEGEAFLRINSLGYRDAERGVAKAPGTLRIAVLGDSFAEARQVALEDTFASRLGPALGQGCPALAGRPVEVLNFGVSGYATTEELLTLRQDALRFAPDWVLLALYPGNDIGENSRLVMQGGGAQWRMAKPMPMLQPDGQLLFEPLPPQPLWRRALYTGIHHSRLLEVLNEARRVWEVRKMKQAAGQAREASDLGISKEVYVAPADAAWREAWQVTEALLATMAREARAGGARFAVAVVTMSEQVLPDPAARAAIEKRLGVPDLLYAEQRIAEFGARQGFPVIRLAQPLQELATRERVHLHGFENTVMGHGHWNARGHRAAAEVMARELCRLL